MTYNGMTILDHTLAELSREFGDPVCRGDCCWWTLSRVGRKPVRLSVFIDGDPDRAEGWLCDLQDPTASTLRFVITTPSEVNPLILRILELTSEEAEHAEAEQALADSPDQQPPGSGR